MKRRKHISTRKARCFAVAFAAWAVVIVMWATQQSGATAPANGADYRIDVNTAGAAALRLLPGVGEALAARIVEDREANGAFRDMDDLQRVRGIGASVSRQATGLVRFGAAR